MTKTSFTRGGFDSSPRPQSHVLRETVCPCSRGPCPLSTCAAGSVCSRRLLSRCSGIRSSAISSGSAGQCATRGVVTATFYPSGSDWDRYAFNVRVTLSANSKSANLHENTRFACGLLSRVTLYSGRQSTPERRRVTVLVTPPRASQTPTCEVGAYVPRHRSFERRHARR